MANQSKNLVRQVALLRGINVGGKNKLPMKDLAEMFAAAGCGEVRTYIQSGNVVFSCPPRVAAGLSGVISARIAKAFGHKIPVVLRTREQLELVIANNPFLKRGAPAEGLHVMFLADMPGAEQVAGLDAKRSPPDEFIVSGQEIYLRLPKGAGDSKLTNAYFDSKLATVSTARNWRTTTQLWEMMK